MSTSQSTAKSSKSFAELEKENCSLRIKLERLENKVRAIELESNNLIEHQKMEELLRRSEALLATELADAKLLQTISGHLIHEEHIDKLYTKITEAAVSIMQSDFASMQMYYPERGAAGQLRLLASSNIPQAGKDFWAWVGVDAGTTCAVAMRTGKRFISSDLSSCEFVVNKPDHEMFASAGVISAQSTPLFSRSGKLLGMISTHWKRSHLPSDRDLNLLDILARQAADLIERKIAEDALKQSELALLEADRRKDEFLATLAHELRNPLAPIRNALHIMRFAPSGNKAQEMLAMMDRQVMHLVRLIDDLLDVSRISQGKIELRRERIVLQSAIRDALEASGVLIENNAHMLTLNLPEEPIWVYADLTRVAQIISNLLNNSAKYTPRGGQITVSLCGEKGYAILSVRDTGLGIPTGMLSKVFDLFTQMDRNHEGSQGGLGIGLALVKQLLDMHGGEIEAKSLGLNQGSTFTIRLPLAPDIETDLCSDLPSADYVGHSSSQLMRILVVDDNIASAETIAHILELSGYETTLAYDGCEALALATSFYPDAILLDIDLPGISGHDVCRELRKNPLFKDTLVVAQTGYGQDRDRQLTKEAGFDYHLVKPFDFEELFRLLAEKSSLRQQLARH